MMIAGFLVILASLFAQHWATGVVGAFLETRQPDLWRELERPNLFDEEAIRQVGVFKTGCPYLRFVFSRRATQDAEIRWAVWISRLALIGGLAGLGLACGS